MHRIGRFVVLASSVACASGGSTRVEQSWREPSGGALAFNRVLTAYVTPDQAARRAVEDKLASRIPNGFAAYRTVPELSVTDPDRAREQLRGKLFDAAVVMRVVEVENRQTYVPGDGWYAVHPGFYDYWGSSWIVARNPGYTVDKTLVTVETRIYSIGDDRLVWAGRTRTENPASADKLVERTVDAVARELRSQGLLAR